MAMIKVCKGNKSLLIPAGAYKHQYAPHGWTISNDVKPKSEDFDQHSKNMPGAEVTDENGDQTSPQGDLNTGDEDEEVEYVDPEELATKPLDELDRDELTILAEYKGLDVSTLTTKKQLKEALRQLS